MRRLGIALSFVVLMAATSKTGQQSVWGAETTAATTPHAAQTSSDDRLIVHEWGTFTSFSGSDGIRLEFRPLVDEDLPPFVLDRFLQAGVPSFTKSQVRVRMRMETPVTYFYTDRERDVNVRVSFPDGLLTEFYPPVERMEPSYSYTDTPKLKGSVLDWGRVHLIPMNRLQAQVDDASRRRLLESLLWTGLVPSADPKFHYVHARETDSALVHVQRPAPAPKAQPLAPIGDFFEKFLFYRGVGNFELPLTLTAASDGSFDVANSGQEPIRSLFLVDVNGKNVRFAATAQVAAGSHMKLALPNEPNSIENLADAVQVALVSEGLYEKEAAAMVKTWRSSWFGERGTRLLYMVPRQITDKLLPLEISPAPEEAVRVLVGRMEIMTPEQESRVTSLVQQSAAERLAALKAANFVGAAVKYAGPAELKSLGRLAEPALIRIRAISKDPAVRSEAKQLLRQMNTLITP